MNTTTHNQYALEPGMGELLRARPGFQHCELCRLFHDQEGEFCPVGSVKPGYVPEPFQHCVHWWDGEGCCRCGSDPCAAAVCALG